MSTEISNEAQERFNRISKTNKKLAEVYKVWEFSSKSGRQNTDHLLNAILDEIFQQKRVVEPPINDISNVERKKLKQ